MMNSFEGKSKLGGLSQRMGKPADELVGGHANGNNFHNHNKNVSKTVTDPYSGFKNVKSYDYQHRTQHQRAESSGQPIQTHGDYVHTSALTQITPVSSSSSRNKGSVSPITNSNVPVRNADSYQDAFPTGIESHTSQHSLYYHIPVIHNGQVNPPCPPLPVPPPQIMSTLPPPPLPPPLANNKQPPLPSEDIVMPPLPREPPPPSPNKLAPPPNPKKPPPPSLKLSYHSALKRSSPIEKKRELSVNPQKQRLSSQNKTFQNITKPMFTVNSGSDFDDECDDESVPIFRCVKKEKNSQNSELSDSDSKESPVHSLAKSLILPSDKKNELYSPHSTDFSPASPDSLSDSDVTEESLIDKYVKNPNTSSLTSKVSRRHRTSSNESSGSMEIDGRLDLDSRIQMIFASKTSIQKQVSVPNNRKRSHLPPSPYRSKKLFEFWAQETVRFRQSKMFSKSYFDPTIRRKLKTTGKVSRATDSCISGESDSLKLSSPESYGYNSPSSSSSDSSGSPFNIEIPEVSDASVSLSQLSKPAVSSPFTTKSSVFSGSLPFKSVLPLPPINLLPTIPPPTASVSFKRPAPQSGSANSTNTTLSLEPLARKDEVTKVNDNQKLLRERVHSFNQSETKELGRYSFPDLEFELTSRPLTMMDSSQGKLSFNKVQQNAAQGVEQKIINMVLSRILCDLKESLKNDITSEIIMKEIDGECGHIEKRLKR